MKIDILESSGFCGGVTRALYVLDKTIKENEGKKIYLLGPIVHNTMVNQEYFNKGVVFISEMDLNKLDDGDIVVVSAHGISDILRKKLERFKVVDTTCPYVRKNKDLIKKNEASDIIFIGKKKHTETIALTEDNPNIRIVENEDDLKKFSANNYGVVVNQTTFNIDNLKKIRDDIKQKAPFYEIIDTMCIISKTIQEFLRERDNKYNVCLVVGDKTSNNANSLYEISPYHPTYFISSIKDALDITFRDFDSIIIIGSASTPKTLLKEIKKAIKEKYSQTEN